MATEININAHDKFVMSCCQGQYNVFIGRVGTPMLQTYSEKEALECFRALWNIAQSLLNREEELFTIICNDKSKHKVYSDIKKDLDLVHKVLSDNGDLDDYESS